MQKVMYNLKNMPCSQRNIGNIISLSRRYFKELSSSRNKQCSKKYVDNAFGKYEIVEPWSVSEKQVVPSYICKPPYLDSSIVPDKPEIKSKDQIECMKHSCILARNVLQQAGLLIKPGVTTDFLDQRMHELTISNGAYPSPLNYRGFPKSICTSINNVAAHGIPDNRPLENGDILNVDVTVYLNGYHGDCSTMFEVGQTDNEAKRLISVTEVCLENAMNICKPREKFCNIGNIIEETARKNGYCVVPSLAGHGIGNYFHGPPDIFHFANNIPGEMKAGMTFTIEPVLSQGGPDVEVLEDGWTVVTIDCARTAQIEHTILITDYGCMRLT